MPLSPDDYAAPSLDTSAATEEAPELYEDEAPTQEAPAPSGPSASKDTIRKAVSFAASHFGVDENVLAGMVMKESALREDVISGRTKSKAGAVGIMQFMPDTAKRFGIDPTDPVQSIVGAAAYMRENLDRFDGDYERALAGYNWGENRDTLKRGGADWKTKLPAETADYVSFITEFAGALRGADPQRELPAGVKPSEAGGGRGFVNPPVVQPEEPGLTDVLGDSVRRGVPALMGNMSATALRANAKTLQDLDRVEAGLKTGKTQFTLQEDPLGAATWTPEQRLKLRMDTQRAAGGQAASIVGAEGTKAQYPAPAIVREVTEAKTFGEAWDTFRKDPVTFIAAMGPESLVQSAPGLVGAALMPGGAVVKAATMGAGSAATDYGSQIVELLGKSGVDLRDPAAVQVAVKDGALMERIGREAMAHAAPVGAIDGLSGGAASKLLLPGKVLAKTPVTREVANIGVQLPVQGVMGGVGEALGEVAAGQDIQPGQIFAEVVGEAFSAPAEVAGVAGQAVVDRVKGAPVMSFTEPDSVSATAGLTPIVVPDIPQAPKEGVAVPQPKEGQYDGVESALAALTAEGGGQADPDVGAGVGNLGHGPGGTVGAGVPVPDEGGAGTDPAAPVDGAAPGAPAADVPLTPVETWKGRKGVGFATEKDAAQSVPRRAARRPELDWKVEPAGDRFHVNGYERTQDGNDRTHFESRANEAATSPTNDLPEPTEAQKEAGNYKKGHVAIQGLDISIENPAGSDRKGTDKDGTPWSVTMQHHYGYIKGTKGADKDHVDVIVGPNPDSQTAYIVDQVHPSDGTFDEHKVVLGADSPEQAREIYQSNYDPAWTGGRGVTAMPMAQFKIWVRDGVKSRPLSDLKEASGQPGSVDLRGPATDTVAADPARVEDALRVIENARLKKGEAVKLEVVPAGESLSADVSNKLAEIFGAPIVHVREKSGGANFSAANVGGLIVLKEGASDAGIALTTHEILHGMDDDIKAELIEAIRPMMKRDAFKRDFPSYADAKVDEEIVARVAQKHAKTPEFWREIAAKMGDGKFAKLAEQILSKLDELIGKFRDKNLTAYVSDIEKVRDALTTAYTKQAKRAAAPAGEGADFADNATESAAFKKWFGDSKVVDAEGKPLVVMHSTTYGDIQAFDKKEQRFGKAGYGFYFSNAEGANLFSEYGERFQHARSFDGQQKAVHQYPVYLSLKNPLIVDHVDDLQPYLDAGQKFGVARGVFGNLSADARLKLQKQGYDGIITRETTAPKVHKTQGLKILDRDDPKATSFPVYVAFEPDQIKSAIGNRGAFDPADPRIDFSERERDFTDPEERVEVSTTSPASKKSDANSYDQKWVIDGADIKSSPTHVAKIMDAIEGYNTLLGKGDSSERLAEFHKVVVDNLLWLHDLVPAAVAKRAKLWYDGANAIATDWTDKYGVSLRQSSGVLAVLSPQMDWFKNVSLAERVITTWKSRQNEAWTPAMTAWVQSWVGAAKTTDEKAARTRVLEEARKLEGRKLFDMDDAEAAKFIRVFDETYHERAYRLVTPEGGFGDYVTTSDDGDASVTWGGFGTIEKAVSILRDGSFRNVDAQLGREHKVRNFFNNIISPASPDGHVTIDTHAVAAAFVKALSGAKPEVTHNFGAAGSNAATGAGGTYGLFADAYRDAAAQRRILPREMQSITWEAVRALFPASIKDQLAPKVDAVWDRFKKGDLTREQARKEVHDLSGGIRPMPWEGSDSGTRPGAGGESFKTAIKAKAEEREARTLAAVDTKDKIQISLSAATNSIPGIANLYALAQKGDTYAHVLLQDIAVDSLRHLLAGTSAKVKAERATGLYGGATEPSLGVSLTFTDSDRAAVLAALAKFADNFNQEQIHVRREVKARAGKVFDDGSYSTPVFRWELKKALDRKTIQKVIDKSGLYGLTFGDDFVEAYYVGDVRDERAIAEFDAAAGRADIAIGSHGGSLDRTVARLWPYGQGEGAIGYGSIRGDVPAAPPGASETAARVAAYLLAKGERPGKVKTFDPAEITPEQRAKQERIARIYEALPDNDLKNPRVRKAYAELGKELRKQFAALPVKVELMSGQGEPYASSAAMRRDVLDNNHLFIFGTDAATFGPEGADFTGHPLLEPTGLTDINGAPLLANDLLRAVHDYYAHNLSAVEFGPKGEEAAWKNHMAVTTNPWARWALTSETRGQNSWVNFRDEVQGVPVKERPFARQKVALLPVEFSMTGDRAVDAPMKEFVAALPVKQRNGSLADGIDFAENPYGDAPDNLMGFRKSAPNKGFAEQKYRHVEFVRVTWENGNSILEAQRGLNKPHALERARRNWADAEISAVPREIAAKEDPQLVADVDSMMEPDFAINLNSINRPAPKPQSKATDGWILSRDELGNFRFGAGQKLYNVISHLAYNVAAKVGFAPMPPELRRAVRVMKLEVERAQTATAAVATEMAKMPEAHREMISDIIEGELKAGVTPPKQVLQIAATISALMSQQSDDLVAVGMLSQDAADKWRDKYLPRFYAPKLGASAKSAWDKAILALNRKPGAMRGIGGKSLKRRGMTEVIDVADLKSYEALGWEVDDKGFNPAIHSRVTVHRDFTRQEREKMGEIRDSMFRFVMGYIRSQKDLALGRLYEHLAGTLASRTELPGYVRVPDTKVDGTDVSSYGKLAGMYVPEEVMSHLSNFNEGDYETLLKAYRKGLGMWKEGKTALNPVSHMNNVVSNLTMAHFAGVSYWDGHKYLAAIKDFVSGSPMLEEARANGLFGGTVSQAELMNMMPKQLQILAKTVESRTSKNIDFVFNAMTMFLRKPMGAAYQAEDVFFRYLIYKDARARGLHENDAVDYSQRYIFTYDDLPRGARIVRDTALPFFSYTYKVVPVLAHTALAHPWRYAAPATLLTAVNTLMYAVAAGDGEDEDWMESIRRYVMEPEFRAKTRSKEQMERKYLPPWMKGDGFVLKTPKTVRLGTDDLTQLPVFLDTSRFFPGGDLLDINSNTGGMPWFQNLTPSNPLLSTMGAMLWNRDPYFGKDVVDSNDTAAEAATKRGQWLWSQFAPAISINNYIFNRSMNAVANATGKSITWWPEDFTGVGKDGLPVQPKYAAMQNIGIKARPIDLEMSAQIAEGQKKKMIREMEAEIRSIRRLSGRGALTAEQAQARIERNREKIGRIRGGLDVDGNEKE